MLQQHKMLLNSRASFHAGFTLIELTLVLALLLCILSLSLSNVAWLDRLQVRADAQRLTSFFRYVQRCAMMKGVEQQVTIDVAGRCVRYAGRSEVLSPAVEFGVLTHAQGPPSRPLKNLTRPVTFDRNRISFFPEGTISAGGIYLIDRGRHCLYALSCSVAQASYLRLYRYDRHWVLIS